MNAPIHPLTILAAIATLISCGVGLAHTHVEPRYRYRQLLCAGFTSTTFALGGAVEALNRNLPLAWQLLPAVLILCGIVNTVKGLIMYVRSN